MKIRSVDESIDGTGKRDSYMEHCELSVVMPCLDEADTVGKCISKALQAISSAGVLGEVIVADNGSRDGSQQISVEAGARLVEVDERGYGAALMSGIEASHGNSSSSEMLTIVMISRMCRSSLMSFGIISI